MAQIDETELDLRALASALRRKLWLLALVVIVAAVGTYVGLSFVSPIYTADTRILIEERESPLTRPRDETGNPPAADFDESAIQSQVEVLKSREIADAVIDKLGLTNRPEFDPAREPSIIRSLLVMLGIGAPPTDTAIRQRVMDGYFDRLSVYTLQKSRVIGVEFSASSPSLSAEVANAIADAFVALQQDAKRQSAIAATEWLQQEIERLRGRVAEAEQAVADYRAEHGLFDLGPSTGSSTGGGNLSTQQLGDINAELARARAARAEAEAKAQLVQGLLDEGGAIESSEDVLNSQLIQRLRERQGALRAQIAELSTTLLPTHPRIKALQGQVQNLEAQIRDEAQKVLASLQTAARVAAAREESLLASLNAAKDDVSVSNDQDIQLRALEREAAAQRDLLESFLGRYREAAARTDANYLPADARVISRAVPPEKPSFPKKTMMAVAVALAALLIAAAVILLREFISGRAFRLVGAAGGVEYIAPPDAARPRRGRRAPALRSHGVFEALFGPDPVVATHPAPEQTAAPEAAESTDTADTASTNIVIEERPTAVAKEEPEPDDESGMGAERHFDEPSHAAAVATEEATAAAVVASDATPTTESGVDDDHLPADQPPSGDEDAAAAMMEAAPAAEHTGLAALGDIILSPDVRVALFAGAQGGEGAGGIAFTAARQGAKQKLRCLVIDMGREPSEALGNQRPGLCDLLAGDAAFGEVIQRDETVGVHVIPYGTTGTTPPMARMRLVLGALTHTYDRVLIVADKLADWPDEHVRPDVAAIVCGPGTDDETRAEVYDAALDHGAKSAIIVRYTSDLDFRPEESAAA